MPYFIAQNHPECDTDFAVVKEGNELVACHPTEESATQQMIAISIAEGIEPGGTFERQDWQVSNGSEARAEHDDGASTPAEPEEQIEGSDENEPGSAKGAGGDIKLDDRTKTGLRNKVKEHNEKMEEDDKPAYTRTTYGQLAAVYRRGAGAYSTSHRPGTSRAQWAMARVNAYLYLLRNERPENANYVTDNDLLPEAHPKSTRSTDRAALSGDRFTTEAEADDRAEELGCEGAHTMDDNGQTIYMPCSTHGRYEELTGTGDSYASEQRDVDLSPPAYMRASARRGLEFHEAGLSGDGLVDRTIREARAMAEGNVTADKWSRTSAWIARHLGDLDSPDANPNSDNFPSPGVVAMALWGGGTTKRSAERAMAYADGVVSRIEEENEGRATGAAVSKFEQRVMVSDLDVRSEDGMTLEGYAAVFNSRSENLGGFTETISPGAFSQTLKARNDIKLLWNHDTSAVLGSTRAGTLKLMEDERGLKVTAELPDTNLGRDIAYLVKRGDIDSFSFGFSVNEDRWNSRGTERTLESVRLFETSLVSFPAYSATAGTAVMRGLDKIAQRADVDPDQLADALLKVEGGEEISQEQKSLLSKVIDTLSPEQAEEQGEEFDSQSWLDLKKTKLEYLKKKA